MTQNALKLIGAETFCALTGHPVYTEMFTAHQQRSLDHIHLAEWADALIIAPATANILGKMSCGVADDLLSTTFLACSCPVGLVPAMNDQMYAHSIVQRNVQVLKDIGCRVLEPVEGQLASGKVGRGRMPEPEAVFEWIVEIMTQQGK